MTGKPIESLVKISQAYRNLDAETKLLIVQDLLSVLILDADQHIKTNQKKAIFTSYIEGKLDAFQLILKHLTDSGGEAS